jgi:C1A family cysteine protease
MVGSYSQAPSVDELRQAIVNYGVIAVTVAAGSSFSPDTNGRIKKCGNGSINHMVNLVGYRPAPSGGYEFLIANSWGTGWGDGGFAWSKQGCNRLASTPGDAALFFEVTGQ